MTQSATPAAAAPVAIPRNTSTLLRRVLTAFRTNDADTLEAEVKDADETVEKLQKDNDDLTAKLAAKDAEIEELKKKLPAADEAAGPGAEGKPGTPIVPGPDASANRGVLMTGDAMTALVARAEIVAPGVKLPTNDAAKPGNGEALKRAALVECAKTNPAVASLCTGHDLAKLTNDTIGVLFDASYALMVQANTAKVRPAPMAHDAKGTTAIVQSMNEKAAAGWKSRGAK